MDEQNLNYDLANIFAPQLAAQTQALQAIAMRPQKTSARTFTTSTSTPRALEDMIMRRNSIGANNQRLLDALKGRETWNYNLGAGLANLAPVQGYGDWGVNALRAFGGAMNRPTDAQIAREQAAQELAQKDLETALAFDKAMGETQTQQQTQEMGYTPMEYGTASAKGTGGQESAEQEVYDFTPPAMPEKPVEWSDIDVQGQRADPETGVPSVTGLLAKYTGLAINPEGRYSKNANQNAYTKSFTVPAITKVAKAAGGSRGIDTMPEVNIKGGPELSSSNMNATEFANAVKDQSWDIADQIIKANPNATITREELANALINNFNHRIRKEYRVVQGFNVPQTERQSAQPSGTATRQYDYSKYGF